MNDTSIQIITVLNSENKETTGYMTKADEGHMIMFSEKIFGQKLHLIHTEEIKDVASLIAAYLSSSNTAKGSDEKFKSVTVQGGKSVEVKYLTKDDLRMYDTYYLFNDELIKEGSKITLPTIKGNMEVDIADFGLKFRKLPVGLQYTKNKVLNYILSELKAPYDIDGAKINNLNKKVKAIQEKLKNGEGFSIHKNTFRFSEKAQPLNRNFYTFEVKKEFV